MVERCQKGYLSNPDGKFSGIVKACKGNIRPGKIHCNAFSEGTVMNELSEYLTIYLNDHRAGAGAGLVARRGFD